MIHSFCQLDEVANRRCVCQGFLDLFQLLRLGCLALELWVRWRREEKVIAQALLEEAPVAGCKRGI